MGNFMINFLKSITGGFSTTRRDVGETRGGFEVLPGSTDDINDVSIVGNDGNIVTKSESPELFEQVILGETRMRMSPERAMSLSAVYSCIDRIASNISMIPVNIMQKKSGKTRVVESHSASFLLRHRPNEWQNNQSFIQAYMFYVLGWGNSCFSIQRTRMGEILQFEMYHPASVNLINTQGNRWVYNTINDVGEYKVIFPDEMAHIRAIGSGRNRWGKSPIMQHADLVIMGLEAQRYGKSFFSSGGKPSGIVGVKGEAVSQAQLDELKTNWRNASKNAGDNKLVFLPADVTYNAMTISPLDANLVQIMGLSRSEINGIYNVPGYMTGDLSKSNTGNTTNQSTSFVRNTLQPWITSIESELNAKLLTRDELINGLHVYFDMDVLTRGTPIERAQRNHYAITDGWLNRNEVREEEGYERIEGQGMDDFTISVNAVRPGNNENDSIGQGKDDYEDEPTITDEVIKND
ncbi:portal protein [Dickeya phage Sucellus]|nr:portal protein [Dickeya phage Sucellus]